MSLADARALAALRRRRREGTLFLWISLAATLLGIAVLALLLVTVVRDGAGRLDLQFLTSGPSRRASEAGIFYAMAGSLWLLGLTALLAFPVGVGAAVYLQEYAGRSRLASLIEINITNLAGVPSIIYGLLGYELFVRALRDITNGASVLSGALTMSLLILPLVIVSAREALKTVPDSLRQAALAVGATRWQMVRDHVLPAAAGGILTGTILSLSRAMGEAAPLIAIGALTFVPFAPAAPTDRFTAMPIQIFNWVSRPQPEFAANAAAGIIVLLVVLLAMNSVAIILRTRTQRRIES